MPGCDSVFIRPFVHDRNRNGSHMRVLPDVLDIVTAMTGCYNRALRVQFTITKVSGYSVYSPAHVRESQAELQLLSYVQPYI